VDGGASARVGRKSLSSGQSVEQGDGGAVGDGRIVREETVVQQRPERRGRDAVGTRKVPREAGFNGNEHGKHVRQRAGGARDVDVYRRPPQDDPRWPRQDDVNSHRHPRGRNPRLRAPAALSKAT